MGVKGREAGLGNPPVHPHSNERLHFFIKIKAKLNNFLHQLRSGSHLLSSGIKIICKDMKSGM